MKRMMRRWFVIKLWLFFFLSGCSSLICTFSYSFQVVHHQHCTLSYSFQVRQTLPTAVCPPPSTPTF
ncbi:unnamed protein product [Sphagnum balticum]